MDMLVIIGVLFLVAPIVVSIIAMVKVSRLAGTVLNLEQQIAGLKHSPNNEPENQPPQEAQSLEQETPAKFEEAQTVAALADESAEQNSVSDPVALEENVAQTHDESEARFKDVEATQPKTNASGQSLEETIGTRWAVWIGGLALGLGGIFLIRYSIEAGVFGPGVRLTMAAGLGFVLLAAGEFFRRRELASPISGVDAAAIPPILTSAGIATLYGAAYSAYALYGFIGAGFAFVLMAIIAMIALAVALLHGPFLAGAGFLGAYLTPLLASSGGGNIPALYVYLVLVSIPVVTLARVRLWYWLMLGAVIATLGWGALTLFGNYHDDTLAHALYLSALGLIFAVALYRGLHLQNESAEEDQPLDFFALISFAALSVLSYFHYVSSSSATPLLAACGLLVILQIGLAWRWSAARGHLAIAACLGLVALLSGPKVVAIVSQLGTVASWSVLTAYSEQRSDLVLKALLLAIFFCVPAIFAIRRFASKTPYGVIWWAATGTIVPLITLAIVYLVLNQMEPSMPFAMAAAVLGVFYAYIAKKLLQDWESEELVAAIFIIAALASAALALTVILDKGWLTIALALTSLGTAFTAQKLMVRQVGPAAAIFAILVGIRLFIDPLIVGADVGTIPIFNWLLWGYGVPAGCFFFGALYLRRVGGALWPSQILDALSMIAIAALVGFQIRHLMNDGSILPIRMDLAEVSVHGLMALALSIGYGRLSVRVNSSVMRTGSLLIASLGLLGLVGMLGVLFNPVFTGEAVGNGHIFNLLTLGYLLPGILAAWLAREAILLGRPAEFIFLAKLVAGAFLFLWLNLVVRHAWHGTNIGGFDVFDGEFYTYSAMWLGCGIVLLLVGIYWQKEGLRKISGALLLLAVLKIFIFDTAQLEGVLRALSFIGLGVILIGIALLYQRILFGGRKKADVAPPTE